MAPLGYTGRFSRLRGIGAGFALGYLLGIVAMGLEELSHGISPLASLAEWHHHAVAIWIGAFGAVLGYFTAVLGDRVREAERATGAQRDFLQTLIDTVPVPIFYKDRGGRYLGCNAAFERFLGRRREEFQGKSVYEMGPKEIADKYFAKDQELFDQPGSQVYDWLVTTRGGPREVVFHKATFTDGQGAVAGLVGAVVDVTDQRRGRALLDRETARHALLFGADSPLAILTVSPGGEILSLSPSLAEMLGVARPSELLGLSAGPLFDTPAALADLLEAPPGGDDYRVLALRTSAGERLRVGVSQVREGAKVHLIFSALTGEELLIPICAWCLRMRDGDARAGAWVPPPEYLHAHEEAVKDPRRPLAFTHAICPDCTRVHHPEAAQE